MKTVKYVKKDGYQVVVGFDTLRIDPVETANKVKETMRREGLPEEVKRTKQRIAELWSQYKAARKAPAPALEQWQMAYDEANAANAEAHKVLTERIRELRDKEAVYMHVRPGEMRLEPNEIEALVTKAHALRCNEALLVNGDIIPDMVDTEYYVQTEAGLKRRVIDQLGVTPPSDARVAAQLTPEEIVEIKNAEEKERIGRLGLAARDAERMRAIAGVKSNAVTMRSQWEIEGLGSKEALDLTRKWYEQQISKIEERYL